jgi:hypothetical protein
MRMCLLGAVLWQTSYLYLLVHFLLDMDVSVRIRAEHTDYADRQISGRSRRLSVPQCRGRNSRRHVCEAC